MAFPLLSPADPVLPADRLNDSAIRLATRASLAQSANYFRELAKQDPEGWFIPPIRLQKVVDWVEVDVHYSQKEIEIPVYEYETYETYERVGGGSALDATSMQKVTRQRIKRQTGTKKELHHYHDPNGKIVVKQRSPIYGDGGPNRWHIGGWGANCLVVYAMRQAGVPANDPAIVNVAERLNKFLEDYGIPDHTWDLAWMTAAFSTLPGDTYVNVTKRLASKIIDGQINNGKARGLWGSICVHPELLATLLVQESELTQELQKAKAELKEKENAKRELHRQQVENALIKVQERIRAVGLLGSQLHTVESPYVIDPSMADPIQFPGSTHFFYNQTLADIESTSLALFALGEAARQGRLPPQTEREKNKFGIPLVPPEKTQAVLARAVSIVADSQQKNGAWDEMNRHQPVHAFDGFKFLPVPVDDKSFPGLTSTVTAASTAAAVKALLSVGDAVGLEAVSRKYGKVLAQGDKARKTMAQLYLDDKLQNIPIGGLVPPYDMYFYLTGVQRRFGTSLEDARDISKRLTYRLLTMKQADGSWGTDAPTYILPSSHKARIKALPVPKGYERAVSAEIMRKAYVNPFYVSGELLHYAWVRERVIATSLAMLFLAEGVRPPVAGVYQATANAESSGALWLAMRHLRKKFNTEVTYGRLSGELTYGDTAIFPVLFVSGAGEKRIVDPTAKALATYIQNEGMIVVEVGDNTEGAAFAKSVQDFVQATMPTLHLETWTDANFLGDLAGKVNLQAHVDESGRAAIVYLPITSAEQPTAKALNNIQAAKLVSNILQFRIDSEVLQETYPTALGERDLVVAAKEGMDQAILPEPIASDMALPPPAAPAQPGAAAPAPGEPAKPEEPKGPDMAAPVTAKPDDAPPAKDEEF